MDFFEQITNMAKEAKAVENEQQLKLMSLAPHFETEEEAFEYAKRLTQLKPGDRIRIFDENTTGLTDAIVVGRGSGNDSDCIDCMWYDADNKILRPARLSICSVTLL